jgi:predicted CoA-substrate-specific enzyme activase
MKGAHIVKMGLRVGLDVGSTTIKMIVLNEDDDVISSQYRRHFSDITATLRSMITRVQRVFFQKHLSVMITGSAGIGLSQNYQLPFIQEVTACSHSVRAILPDTDIVIELGGEDAKITYFNSPFEQKMNGVCAGGTGAFIDQMAALLGTDPTGLNELAKNHQTIYPIASRCGVFAKTDIQALLNEGVTKADIAASVLQAVVNQVIGGLAQGRPITGKVAFLGGPLYFLSELRNRFIQTLQLSEEQVFVPEHAQYFVALGAALALQEEPVRYEDFVATRYYRQSGFENSSRETHAPLFSDQSDYRQFQERHGQNSVKRGSLADYSGNAYLGLDVGSTTTKMALIGEDGSLLHSFYGPNMAKPVDTAVSAIKELYALLNEQTHIANSVVTGYGEKLAQAALGIDLGEVETVAHFKAANHFLPGVSFVLDIGGQDMKSFFIRDGVIESIVLNEACSAGCGSFLENFAQSLGMEVRKFAQLGTESRLPVDLGTRCTVFMNSKVKQAHKDGANIRDIAAGICISIIRNALYKMIRIKSPADLGDKIVVQGGTFYNDSVLRAMESTIGREVVRPDIAGIMGAYGAALIARDRCSEDHQSTLIRAEQINDLTSKSSTGRCSACGNSCLITSTRFSSGQSYYSGNRCERGSGNEKVSNNIPNIYEYKYQRVFDYAPLKGQQAARGTIGIPRVLNMYEDYPFWFTFFTTLGYRVILSGRSNRLMYESGMDTIPSESLCYPAKLVHGHVIDLVNRGVKEIFYPCITFNTKEDPEADNCYNCPIVTSYPENIKANIDVFRTGGASILHPFLPIASPERLAKRLVHELSSHKLTLPEVRKALKQAYLELDRYRSDVRRKADDIVQEIRDRQIKAVVLAGRPYHLDPEINHGIDKMIQSFGLAILSEDAVSHMAKTERPLRVVDQWVYHSRLYSAATYVAGQPDMELIQLNSFGCGLDAVAIDQVRDILGKHHRIHTVIKQDEISNLGAAKIRVRSLLAAVNEQKDRISSTRPGVQPKSGITVTHKMKKEHTFLAPQMSPVHFNLFESAFKRGGYNAEVLQSVDREAVDEGLKYVHNDTCYPAIIVIGQIIKALKSGRYDLDNLSILLPQTGGGCRATNYVSMLDKALKDAGLPVIPVVSLKGAGISFSSLTLLESLIQATVYGDLLTKALHRSRPYEKISGSANQLFAEWNQKCGQSLRSGGRNQFKHNINEIIRDFDNLETMSDLKPKVGIVGEILLNYHPFANNNLADLLEKEGAEVILPDLMDFFLYCAFDHKVNHELLDGSYSSRLGGEMFIKAAEWHRSSMRKALLKSKKLNTGLHLIEETANKASKHVSLGHQSGEGWLLTGKMVEMINSDVNNIICVQPFACLPNQITGKGMMKELRNCYPQANIMPIDYDPGESEINQLNRIKLFLATARERSSNC